jgi:predicted transcriptional regulator
MFMVVKIGRRLSKNMFLNEKLVDLYLNITSGPLNYVCTKLDLNYSHALEILNIWESMGLIVKNKSGYRYNLFYTSKGKSLVEYLSRVRIYLKRTGIQWEAEDGSM